MTDSPSIIAIPVRIRTFLTQALRFATLATTDPDGTPRQAVIWYTLDGDEIVLNSRVGRRWPTNLVRDPRTSLAVSDGADGYRWIGMTGEVRAVTDRATTQADIAGMARRYHADDPAKAERLVRNFETQVRISFRFRPNAIHDHIDDD